jgi:hypothetical protein
LEFKGDKRPSSFYLGHFSLSKSFNHITKDASNLKLSDNHRLSYFSTSTPSTRNSHHQGWSIASRQFLTCKYVSRPSIGSRLWSCIDFHSNFEPTSCHFSLFFYFTPLYICLIYGVFHNKDLQVFSRGWLCK